MRRARLPHAVLLAGLSLALLAPGCWAKVYVFDLGSEASPVQQGYQRISPTSRFADSGAGWVSAGKLEVQDQAYNQPIDGPGGSKLPPVWTTPLSEDCIVSGEPAEFAAKVDPGKYHAWLLCGVSVRYRAQLFSFDVVSGSASVRVQFEGSYQYRDAYLDVDAGGGEAHLRLMPRSLFAVSGIVLWQDADAEHVQADIIRPEREVLDFMPPAEAAKWTLEPRVVENSPWPAVSESDRRRGYLVHTRHWAEDVYPYTVPIAQEINPTLKAFATPGQYEPLNFIVYPFRAFGGASVTVSDLKSGPATIPSSAIELRRIRYMRARPNYTVVHQYRIVPDPLMPYDPAEPLRERENARFWLTVHVPPDARPGLYRGAVTFAPEGSSPATIPIVFRVLPFRLQEDPTKLYAIYYQDPLDDWARARDPVSKAYFLRKSDWELDDLVAHGTRNVVTSLWSAPEKPGQEGKFSFDFDLMQMKIDRWRQHGFRGPLVVEINAGGIYRKYTGVDLGNHIDKAAPPPAGYGQELTRMCKAIEAERVRRGWPEILYYPIDEPGSSEGAIAFMIATLKAVQAAGVKTYVTADPTLEGFAPLKPYIDVWCTQPFAPSREEILHDEATRKVDYWCYPNHVNGENDHTTVNGARMTYGFGFWRSGFSALIPWIYRYDDGNPWNYLCGSTTPFFNRTEDSGRPIPVQMWEAYRGGYDDYRYIYTLEQTIARARWQGGAPARAAEEAQKDLTFCWDQIRVQPKYKYDDLWEPREADVYRWIVAHAILKLQAAGAELPGG